MVYNANLTKAPTKKWLERYDWRYSKAMSDEETTIYTHRFPVYKYGITMLLDCEFILDVATNEVSINVYDSTSRGLYAPWYYTEYGNYNDILKIIDGNIEKEMKRLDIVYVDGYSRTRL